MKTLSPLYLDGTNIPFVEYENDNRKEKIPYVDPGFPYNLTIALLDRNRQRFAPWHWHPAVELFYIEQGSLEYETPNKRMVYPKGYGGLINANVLHTCHSVSDGQTIQKLHIFDPSLLATPGSTIAHQYILPITFDHQFEQIPLDPRNEDHKKILDQIIDSFTIDTSAIGYEIELRNRLSTIWLEIYRLISNELEYTQQSNNDQRLKSMLITIHEQYNQPIDVATIAQSGSTSVRECYRLFNQFLHTSPMEYLRRYRIEKACQLLSGSDSDLTTIAYNCGFTSSAHFSRAFKDLMDQSPRQYRKQWQNTKKN